jgi:hypothetical protein
MSQARHVTVDEVRLNHWSEPRWISAFVPTARRRALTFFRWSWQHHFGVRVIALSQSAAVLAAFQEDGFDNTNFIDDELGKLNSKVVVTPYEWNAKTIVLIEDAERVDPQLMELLVAHAKAARAVMVWEGPLFEDE